MTDDAVSSAPPPFPPRSRLPAGKPGAGSYRGQVLHRADGMWYDMQDLAVTEVLPQQVALAEAFVQVYELKGAGPAAGGAGEGAAGGSAAAAGAGAGSSKR